MTEGARAASLTRAGGSLGGWNRAVDRLRGWCERRWPRAGVAAVAGACVCFSMPPWGWWPLTFVGIALWAVALDGRSRGQRFWVGALVGLTWFMPSTLWMLTFSPPGWIVGVGVWFPVVCGVTSLACPPRHVALALPGALVVSEWVRWHAPFGGVPLSTLAVTQGRGPLLRIAPLFATLGTSAAVAVVGATLAALVTRSGRDRAGAVAALASVAALALAGPWLGGSPSAGDGRTARVAVVQGGGAQQTISDRTDYSVVLGRHIEAARTIEPGAVDLVVLPENIVNVSGWFEGSTEEDQLVALARDLDTTVVVGIVEDHDDPKHFWNAAVAIEPSGEVVARYDKVRRVPFGEYTPMRGIMTWLAEATGSFVPPRDAVPGTKPAVLDTAAGRLGVAVSWEVFFPRRIREAARRDAEVLLNPTNGSSYWLTQVQSQQVNQSALRAAETGRWLLQSSPTGFSAIIDPSGRVIARTGLEEQRVLRAVVRLRTNRTVATRWGEIPAWLFAAVTLAAAWALQHRCRPDGEPGPSAADGAPSH